MQNPKHAFFGGFHAEPNPCASKNPRVPGGSIVKVVLTVKMLNGSNVVGVQSHDWVVTVVPGVHE